MQPKCQKGMMSSPAMDRAVYAKSSSSSTSSSEAKKAYAEMSNFEWHRIEHFM